LTGLALLKVRRFLDSHLRLRTACDFRLVGDVKATAPAGFVVPQEAELLAGVQQAIGECKALFADSPTELVTPVKVVKGKKGEEEAKGETAS
jgi:CRISPR-associated protein Csb1